VLPRPVCGRSAIKALARCVDDRNSLADDRIYAFEAGMRETDVTGSGTPTVRVGPGRSLRAFTGTGYDKGAGRLKQAAWFVVLNLVFRPWWCPRSWRPGLLRAFGASVGERVLIRHRVRVL
jgi:hypothetical protein